MFTEQIGMLRRSNVLERFAVINAQLHSITAQIVPLLEHYVVYPKVSDMQHMQQLGLLPFFPQLQWLFVTKAVLNTCNSRLLTRV